MSAPQEAGRPEQSAETGATPGMTPGSVVPDALADTKYRCGTLQYTKAGLFVLFGWLLWGDFCFTAFETVGGPGILSLYLQDNFHVSNFHVNLMFSVIPQVIAVLVGPPLSFKSDRYRSRWGRRIPFMLFTMPFLCLFAAAIGFSDEILAFLKSYMGPASFLSPLTVGLLVIGVLVAAFTFFNEFVQNVYWYLFADVVPEAFMGRFIGLFRTVGSVASFLLNLYIMPHQLTHMLWIHVGVAALYFVGFGLMCLGVKEGKYPPPTDVTEKTPFREKARLYFKECFSHRIFVMTYLVTFFTAMSGIIGVAGVFGLHVDQHLATVKAHESRATAIAMSADGQWAISGGTDRRVNLWNCAGEKKELAPGKTLGEHAKAVTCVALSGDGSTAASGDEGGEIKIWKVPTGECLKTLRAGEGGVRCVALLADGGALIAGGEDGKVRVWHLRGGEGPTVMEGHKAAVNCIAVSSDEECIATGSSDKTIRLWSARGWAAVKVLPEASGPVYALCFAPALEAVPDQPRNGIPVIGSVVSYFQRVFSNESLYEIPAESRAKVLAADQWLVSGGRDGQTDAENSAVCIWDVKGGSRVRSLKGHKGAVTSVLYKPDLRMILSGSHDKTMRLWAPVSISNLAGDQSLRTFKGYTTAVTSVACLRDGPILVNASDTGELHVWDIDQGVSLKKGSDKGSFFNIFIILLAFPTGMMVDRFHALRITMLATLLIGPVQMAYYFLAHDYMSFMWLDCVKIPLYCLFPPPPCPCPCICTPSPSTGSSARRHLPSAPSW